MGGVRQYDPSAPAAITVDLEKYPLKMAKVAMDPSKKGWERFRVTLSNEVRSMYMDDAIHAPKWKDLVLDFDRKPLGSTSYPRGSYSIFLLVGWVVPKNILKVLLYFLPSHRLSQVLWWHPGL